RLTRKRTSSNTSTRWNPAAWKRRRRSNGSTIIEVWPGSRVGRASSIGCDPIECETPRHCSATHKNGQADLVQIDRSLGHRMYLAILRIGKGVVKWSRCAVKGLLFQQVQVLSR